MKECSTTGDAEEDRSADSSEPESPLGGVEYLASTSRESARAAGQSLSRFGPRLGWALLALGVLSGLSQGLERAVEGLSAPVTWAKLTILTIDGVCWLMAFGLGGWGAALLCQLFGALIIEYIDRTGHALDELMTQADRGVEALGRIVEALERRAEQPAPGDRSDLDRVRSLAAIDRATRSAHWTEAESLLDAFETAFPDDPALPGLKDQLAANRRQAIQDQMAQLEAAREVNDPARVLELYKVIGPSLEPGARGVLERELARWFLNLFYRRLRSVKIQTDVVLLASQVAEIFGGTVEGASMRAALPTLRRSVGLCPRCAQPYTGTADACPQCLSGGPGLSARAVADRPSIPP